ncbi:MAG: hypothetical protein LBO74_18065 [Candidatus Symbiothrix sp.]|nr:hypothetical protein [Candidatus Symbiothrix sp.]
MSENVKEKNERANEVETKKSTTNEMETMECHPIRAGKVNFLEGVCEGCQEEMRVKGQKYFPLTKLFQMLSLFYSTQAIFDAFVKFGLVATSDGKYDFISKRGLVGTNALNSSEKYVYVVQDTVTAIIMDLYGVNGTWLGINKDSEYNLRSPEVIKLLDDKIVTLFPYAGEEEYQKTTEIADYLKTQGLDVSVDTGFRHSKNRYPYKFDIGDEFFEVQRDISSDPQL